MSKGRGEQWRLVVCVAGLTGLAWAGVCGSRAWPGVGGAWAGPPLGGALAAAQAQPGGDDRIGLAEEFDTLDGWTVARPPLASMRAEGGRAVFETHILNLPAEIGGRKVTSKTFLDIFKPGSAAPEYDAKSAVGGSSGVAKTYGPVDLDKYHYIVMKTDDRPMGLNLELRTGGREGRGGKSFELQVGHSTGLIAQDLAALGTGGRQTVGLYLEIFNSGRQAAIDYIRLVSRLSDEEKAGLIAGPVSLPAEDIPRHPYQRLEALWSRGPRPWTDLPPNCQEHALFRDVGTDMPTWRLTASPAHEGLKGADLGGIWRADGSSVSTPARTYDFATDTWDTKKGTRYWKDLPAGSAKYKVEWDRNRKVLVFKQRDPAGKADKVIHEHPITPGRPMYGHELAVTGSRLVGALIGAEVVVVDAAEDQPPKVKVWPLPPIDAKGIWCDDKCLSYWAPFLSVHRIMVDLDSGRITDGVHHTHTHGMSGQECSIMSYDGISKVLVSAKARTMSAPGKELAVYGVYKTPVDTDYGEMTLDCRYGVTNGLRGELDGQYLLFDRLDPGTVLRLCTYNVSYETWDLRAKEDLSPDYTKIAYASDFLGDADCYMTVVRRPDPPPNVKAARAGQAVKLTWEKPARCREIRGYNVYRSARSGSLFARLNKEIVTGTEFTDSAAPAGAAVCYLLTSEEPSGLTSVFCPEVRLDWAGQPVILHHEAEDLERLAPMREFVDGWASGYRAVRVTKVRDGENTGQLSLAADVPDKGDYWVWGRCRHRQAGRKGAFALRAGDRQAGSLEVAADRWAWVKAPAPVALSPGQKLTLASADEGLLIDKIILSGAADYQPRTADDRKEPPPAPTGLKVSAATPSSIELTWDAGPDADLYCYSVYVGDTPDFAPGNATILCSVHKTAATDWGLGPATRHCYKVVAIDKFGNQSPPASVEGRTGPLQAVTSELPAGAAKASEGLTRGKDGQVEFVQYGGAKAGGQTLGFDFDAPQAGAYYFWIKYTPTFNQREDYDNIGVSVDGHVERWSTRPRPPRGQGDKPGRWFVERLTGRKLEAGRHALVLTFEDKAPLRTRMGQRVAGVWVSNDASFVPPDFTLQVMFAKPTPWRTP